MWQLSKMYATNLVLWGYIPRESNDATKLKFTIHEDRERDPTQKWTES